MIWFAEDIRNALLAANEASGATAEVAFLAKGIAGEDYFAEMRAYRKGYRAALITLALAFGVSPSVIDGSGEQQGVPLLDKPPEMW